MDGDLYDHDFYLWTRSQAKALRARDGGRNQLDYDHLAEEIEEMGSEVRNAAMSFVVRIIQHLYKLQTTTQTDPRNHWRGEIRLFRLEADLRLTTSIRRYIASKLEEAHIKGLKFAKLDFERHEPGVEIDGSARWTLAQILGESEDPLDD